MRRLIPAALLLLVLTACSESGKKEPAATPTPSIPGVEVFTGLSTAHLGKGDYPGAYAQSPPVGGAHSAAWLRCDVYTQPVPKENAVHSMEHGGIWVTYRPGLPAADVQLLTQLTQLNAEYVLVSPYPDQDVPVVASTWGLQLRLQQASDPRLVQFVQTYAGGNQGGEQGAGCRTRGLTLEQAVEFNRQQG